MRTFLLIILLFYFFSGNTQTIKFNKLYIDTYPDVRNIEFSDTSYITMGCGGDDSIYVFVCNIDLNGNLNKKSYLKKNNINLYHGLTDSFQKKNNSYFFSGSQPSYNGYSGVLVGLDNNFDTLWYKEILFDTTSSCIFYGTFMINEDTIISIGATDYLGNSDFILVKYFIDSNSYEYNTFGGNLTDYGYKVVKTKNNEFLLGGLSKSFSPSVADAYKGEWYLVKTDYSGTQIWQNHYGNPVYDDGGILGMFATKDSGVIISGAYSYFNSSSSIISKARIIKLNKYLQIVWDRQYDFGLDQSYINEVYEDSTGNIFALGATIDNTLWFAKTVFLKLNPTGDIIWKREYKISTDTSDVLSYLGDFEQTPDGGFIMAGTVYFYNGTQPNQQMWVVKTDSLGCDGVNECDTFQVLIERQNENQINLFLFPNPVKNFISVNFKNNLFDASITICNIYGQIVYEECIQQNTNHSEIFCEEFPAGMYLVKVRGKGYDGIGGFIKY